MSVYIANIPTGIVPLDEDYLNIQHNFTQLNTTFGHDHYTFDDQTANNGFHNKVTTPEIVGAAHPVTVAGKPVFYAHAQTANLGVLQFSKGPPRPLAVAPSPVTILQSQATAITLNNNANENVLDFTGLARAMVKLFAIGQGSIFHALEYTVFWNGANLIVREVSKNGNLAAIDAGANVLAIRNTTGVAVNNLFWSLQLMRVT